MSRPTKKFSKNFYEWKTASKQKPFSTLGSRLSSATIFPNQILFVVVLKVFINRIANAY